MRESSYHEAPGEQIIAIHFRMKASIHEVVARIFDAIRETDLSLLKILGDGDRVYPSEDRKPVWRASSWRAELLWRSRALNSAHHLEVFLARAEFFLELPGGVQLELGGGQGNPLEDLVG